MDVQMRALAIRAQLLMQRLGVEFARAFLAVRGVQGELAGAAALRVSAPAFGGSTVSPGWW